MSLANSSVFDRDPIKVGILHSLTGTMSASEISVKDATILAIEEINAAGGILGRAIEVIVEDGESNLQTFAWKARKLLTDDRVSVVFGCWTSASRKAVLPIFEQLNGLLFYPVQYEGLERSPNIIYTGAAPNQQIIPAVDFLLTRGYRRLFLVGSDYIFPRTANRIVKAQLIARGGEWVGEEYVPLGSTSVDTAIALIKATQPDAIFNTLNGDSNAVFFHRLKAAGFDADGLPAMSVSVAEEEVRHFGAENFAGHWVAWNYFNTLETPENQRFVAAYQAKYGKHRVTDDPIEAAYLGVYLWKYGVEKAKSTEVDRVRKSLKKIAFTAPGGPVKFDSRNQHTWKTARIGRIRADGSIEEIWNSGQPIRPDPWLDRYVWASGLAPRGFQGEIRLALVGLFTVLAVVTAAAVSTGSIAIGRWQESVREVAAAENPQQMAREVTTEARRYQLTLWIALGTGAIVAPVGAIVVWRVTRALVRVRQTAQMLSSGDLSVRSPIVSGDEIGILSATLNIMAQQIGSLVKGIEVRGQQLEERSRQLEGALEAASAANRAKSRFLANISHELRTPLNAILGYSEILVEEAKAIEAEEMKTDLETIYQSGQHLLMLIQDILDIANIESEQVNLCVKPFSVAELVDEVAAEGRWLCQKNGNVFIVDRPPDLGDAIGDRQKIWQILLNLISNAAKFTNDGEVSLTVRRLESESGQASYLEFVVVDTGIGIAIEQQEHLFEAFWQADDSSTRAYGGTGVGLAIGQKFAQMMGGQITVESQPEIGSTFTLHLPVSRFSDQF